MLGFDVGDSENQGFWTSFLRSLKTRGLDGVRLVMFDAHTGLKKAIGTVLQGAGWQRCRVHFMRNVLTVAPERSQEMVTSIIRRIFAQPDREHIGKHLDEVTAMLGRSRPMKQTLSPPSNLSGAFDRCGRWVCTPRAVQRRT